MKQLTVNTAAQTGDWQIFALRKSAVNGQMSMVKCSSQGFTLIETLVAISILLIAVVGPISLIGDALHKLYYAKDEMIAINLAQEGIEVVRQVRDSNMLGGVAWDTNITTTPGYYTVDAGNASGPPNTFIKTTALTVPQPVYLDPALGGLYWQTFSVSYLTTQFSRIVRIEQVVAGKENKVNSTVTWKTGGATGTITVSENIFKWAP